MNPNSERADLLDRILSHLGLRRWAHHRLDRRIDRYLALEPHRFCSRLTLGLDWQQLVAARARTGDDTSDPGHSPETEPQMPVAIAGQNGAWLLALRALGLYLGPIRPEAVDGPDLETLDRQRIRRVLTDANRQWDRAPWRSWQVTVIDSSLDEAGLRVEASVAADGRIRLAVSGAAPTYRIGLGGHGESEAHRASQ